MMPLPHCGPVGEIGVHKLGIVGDCWVPGLQRHVLFDRKRIVISHERQNVAEVLQVRQV